ncbi:MAG: TlpA family protein disulfide reductase [Bacteroidales bacterium]|jgi:peroxiredoxin|nr:TlpA family protein disulfide reductase [Bacteroidales bacterium]
MKKTLIVFQIVLLSVLSYAQSNKQVPSVQIKTLDGRTVNTSVFENDGNPIILTFWATWCKPCIKELSAIDDLYEDWQDETGVKIIAVSVDDTRSLSKVKPFVDGRGWEYEFYTDANSDLKRAMNISDIPSTFILDGEGNIVWQHTSYSEGGEHKLFEIVKKIKAGKSIEN